MSGIQFIICVDGKWAVTEQAEAFLSSSEVESSVLIPVATLGPYRSGKSWLTSWLLSSFLESPSSLKDGNNMAFPTSPTTEPQTRGLWLSNQLIPLSAQQHQQKSFLLFIDTEGLNSFDSRIPQDMIILALGILFAAELMYNAKGALSVQSMEDLRCAAGIAERLRKGSSLLCSPPHLSMILRDFTLDAVNEKGESVPDTMYFENQLKKLDSKVAEQIQQFFPYRNAITLPPPCEKQADMKHMHERNLVPNFLKGIRQIRRDIVKTSPKMFGNKCLTGQMMLAIAQKICELLNSNTDGLLPPLQSVWDSACQAAEKQSQQQVWQQIHHELQSCMFDVPMFLQTSVLNTLPQKAVSKLFTVLFEPPREEQITGILQQTFEQIQQCEQENGHRWNEGFKQTVQHALARNNGTLTAKMARDLLQDLFVSFRTSREGCISLTRGFGEICEMLFDQQHKALQEKEAAHQVLLVKSAEDAGTIRVFQDEKEAWRKEQQELQAKVFFLEKINAVHLTDLESQKAQCQELQAKYDSSVATETMLTQLLEEELKSVKKTAKLDSDLERMVEDLQVQAEVATKAIEALDKSKKREQGLQERLQQEGKKWEQQLSDMRTANVQLTEEKRVLEAEKRERDRRLEEMRRIYAAEQLKSEREQKRQKIIQQIEVQRLQLQNLDENRGVTFAATKFECN